jgi:hypothetical protein
MLKDTATIFQIPEHTIYIKLRAKKSSNLPRLNLYFITKLKTDIFNLFFYESD